MKLSFFKNDWIEDERGYFYRNVTNLKLHTIGQMQVIKVSPSLDTKWIFNIYISSKMFLSEFHCVSPEQCMILANTKARQLGVRELPDRIKVLL